MNSHNYKLEDLNDYESVEYMVYCYENDGDE